MFANDTKINHCKKKKNNIILHHENLPQVYPVTQVTLVTYLFRSDWKVIKTSQILRHVLFIVDKTRIKI